MRRLPFVARLTACCLVAFLTSCAQTNYQVYEGRGANIIEGQGGTKEVIGRFDIWDNGNPPRRYQVLGVSTVEDFDNVFGQDRIRGAVAEQIKQAGGDAAIVLDGFSQGQSTSMMVLPNGRVVVGSTTGRKQVRYQIVRYLDSPSAQPASTTRSVSPAVALVAATASRATLSKAEVEQLLVGRSHTFKGESGSLRWDLRANGRFFTANLSVGSAGSGTWELKEDGALCVDFTQTYSEPGCVYFFRDGNDVKRTARNASADRVGAVIEIQ